MTRTRTLWVRPVGRDVTLTLAGESPLRYFDAAPAVIVSVAGREIARVNPSADFTPEIVLPADALAAADGRVVISSDKFFVPGEREGTADRRHLALRIYSVMRRVSVRGRGWRSRLAIVSAGDARDATERSRRVAMTVKD